MPASDSVSRAVRRTSICCRRRRLGFPRRRRCRITAIRSRRSARIVRWLKAEAAGVNMFRFPAARRWTATQSPACARPRQVSAATERRPVRSRRRPTSRRVTVLAEARAVSSRRVSRRRHHEPESAALRAWRGDLGDKRPLDAIVHTLSAGRSGCTRSAAASSSAVANLVALGLVVGMDYRDSAPTCTRCCSG